MQSLHALALWGRCRDCGRWFCIQPRHSNADRWHCPDCGGEPGWLENRAHPAYERGDPLGAPSDLPGSSYP